MDKRTIGQLRQEQLKNILEDILQWDTDLILKAIENGDLKKNGKIERGKLAEQVGYGCKSDTFRQNKETMQIPILAVEDNIKEKLSGLGKVTKLTNKEKGDIARAEFLDFLSTVGTADNPAPANHNRRLYRKGIWSIYSKQELDINLHTPNWFSKGEVKEALDALDLRVVNKDKIHTIDMSHDSISDDIDDSMTSKAIRKLRQENKKLQEKVESLSRAIKKYEVENNAVILENKKLKNEIRADQYEMKLKPDGITTH